jgi:hypothetical protein
MRCRPRSSLSRPLFFIRGSAPFSMPPSLVGTTSEMAGLGDVVGTSWMTSESAMAVTTPGVGWFVRRQSGTRKMRYERRFRRVGVNRGKKVQAAARQEKVVLEIPPPPAQLRLRIGACGGGDVKWT